MLIRADTFGGDSHNISGYISNIEIISCLENIQGGFLQNRFAWNCFTTAKAHTFVNPPTKLKHAEKFTFSESSLLLLPWVSISSCCWNRPCLLFCLLWTQPILSLSLSQLLWIYFHSLFVQAVSKYFVSSGNFRCASLTLVRLVTPVHCLQLASIVIDISLPRLHNVQHTGTWQVTTAGGEENSQRQSFSCHCLW